MQKISTSINYIFLLLILNIANPVLAQKSPLPIAKIRKVAEAQCQGYIKAYPDSLIQPRGVNADGSIRFSTSNIWTSGFFAGNLWFLYRLLFPGGAIKV